MKQEILLIGGGGHCRSVIDVIEQENKFEIAGIIDTEENIGKRVLGYKIIATDDELKSLREEFDYAFVTIGQIKTPKLRIKFFNQLKNLGFILPTIVSPLAYVSKHSNIEEGTFVGHNALINANAKIGKNCIINTKALIEHDAVIEDHCHISTSSVINGGVIVKENTFFGSNAMSKEYIQIKANSVIGGGESILR